MTLTPAFLGKYAAGAALDFKVASGAWFVNAGVNFEPLGFPALPIGTTGLYLKGFHGSFGHNVKAEFNEIGAITKIYLAPKESNFIFAAGVRIALENADSLWFDVLLTVVTDPLLIAPPRRCLCAGEVLGVAGSLPRLLQGFTTGFVGGLAPIRMAMMPPFGSFSGLMSRTAVFLFGVFLVFIQFPFCGVESEGLRPTLACQSLYWPHRHAGERLVLSSRCRFLGRGQLQ